MTKIMAKNINILFIIKINIREILFHIIMSAMPQKPRHENTKVAKKALKKDRKDSD